MADDIREVDVPSVDKRLYSSTTHEPVATNVLAQAVYIIVGVILFILGFRVVLVLLGANPANAFANFIYTASQPLIAPFFGLFNTQIRLGISRFEIETLIAMLVYALIGRGLISLVALSGRRHTHYHYR